MKVTIIPIVIGAFGTVTKGLLKGLGDLEVGGWVDHPNLQYYWEQLEYWEESWRLEETCCHSNSSESPLANTDVKNFNELIIHAVRKYCLEGMELPNHDKIRTLTDYMYQER